MTRQPDRSDAPRFVPEVLHRALSDAAAALELGTIGSRGHVIVKDPALEEAAGGAALVFHFRGAEQPLEITLTKEEALELAARIRRKVMPA